jgi:hypothetical protein
VKWYSSSTASPSTSACQGSISPLTSARGANYAESTEPGFYKKPSFCCAPL